MLRHVERTRKISNAFGLFLSFDQVTESCKSSSGFSVRLETGVKIVCYSCIALEMEMVEGEGLQVGGEDQDLCVLFLLFKL